MLRLTFGPLLAWVQSCCRVPAHTFRWVVIPMRRLAPQHRWRSPSAFADAQSSTIGDATMLLCEMHERHGSIFAMFERMDLNNDGELSAAEIAD